MVATTRRALVSAAAMVATAVLVAGQSAAVAEPAARGIAPEADVSHHGYVLLSGDQLGVWLHSENRGPSGLANTTVRFRFSAAVAVRQELPHGCTRGGERTVLCETGALGVDGEVRRTVLAVRVTGRPAEVVVRVDTVWNGGASDRNQRNNTHEVLAPATGDAYVF